MPKLIIACGGRDYMNYDVISAALDIEAPTFLIQGGARGADAGSRTWAYRNKVANIEVPALWSMGKQAGHERNALMLKILLRLTGDSEKAVIAFPGGRGTEMMVNLAKWSDVEVRKYGW